jgi:glycosyltransferase involved in cell wall biosynthesis
VAEQPLVTLITGTWGRPRTVLERAAASVAAQTYHPIEHIIVIDGQDEAVRSVLASAGYSDTNGSARRLVSLGRNWTQPFANESNAAICRLVGTYLARGEFIGVLDDDNTLEPEHVAQMVARFAETGADIVCSDFWHVGGMMRSEPPHVGNVDASSFMYRWQALAKSNWQADGYTCDGLLAERLVAAGCSWAVKPGSTMTITEQRHGRPDD